MDKNEPLSIAKKSLVYCKLNHMSYATCEHMSYFGNIQICKERSDFVGTCPYRSAYDDTNE